MPRTVVCDTNVWYDLPDRVSPPNQTFLIGTLINLLELRKSNWLPERIEVVRKASAQLLMRHHEIRIDPPMVYVARISDIVTDYDSEANAHDPLEFVHGLASGDELQPERLDEFRRVLSHERGRDVDVANDMNGVVASVRSNKIDKRDSNRGKDLDSTKRMIGALVSQTVKRSVGIDEINWDEIDLFLKVTHALYLEMEVSQRKFQPNDFGDHYNLIYVGRQEHYWTSEQRWIRVIQAAGMSHYLFPGS